MNEKDLLDLRESMRKSVDRYSRAMRGEYDLDDQQIEKTTPSNAVGNIPVAPMSKSSSTTAKLGLIGSNSNKNPPKPPAKTTAAPPPKTPDKLVEQLKTKQANRRNTTVFKDAKKEAQPDQQTDLRGVLEKPKGP